MISLTLTQALTLYSAVLGLVIGTIWVYTEFFVRRPQRTLGKQFLWRCAYCGFSYLDESAERISRCPQCDSFNSVQDARAKEGFTVLANEEESFAAAGDARRNTSKRSRKHQRRRGPRRRR